MSAVSSLVLGLPEELAEEFESVLQETRLKLDVDFYATLEDMRPGLEGHVFHYDIIIFVNQGKKNSVGEQIKAIKSYSPLSELIAILFTQDYSTVLTALKMGVRDIIEYPFSSAEVKHTLEKAITYGSITKYSESYGSIISLLNLFARPGGFRSVQDIFQTSERYFRTNLSVNYFEVLLFNEETEPDPLLLSSMEIQPKARQELLAMARENLRFFEKKKLHFVHAQFEHSSFLTINFGTLNDRKIIGLLVIDEDIERVNEIFNDYFFKMIHNALDYQINYDTKEQMINLAHTDDVTGLFNQRKLYKDLHTQVQRFKMTKEPFCIVFIDLDNFKQINDSHGHIIGSDLLLQASQVFLEGIREHDYLYRYGGDEFVIILTKADNDQTKKICQRLLESIKRHAFKGQKGKTIHLSASIGIAEYPIDASSPEEIITMADDMMYNSKKSGRGKVLNARDYLKKKSA